VLRFDAETELERLEKVLTNKEILKKAMIHPMDILKAATMYQAGGMGGKSSKTYTPVPRILNILDEALDASFDCVEPTGLKIAHFIDVSGSMSGRRSETMTPLQAASVLALASIKSEKNCLAFAFDTSIRPVNIKKSYDFLTTYKILENFCGGGTDCSLPFEYLLSNKLNVDVAVCYTDNESWAGPRHTYKALEKYRKTVNPNLKIVFCSLAMNNLVLSRPGDDKCFDIAGVDPSTPKIIQMFAQGEI
jgi:60 kDa SS-A/Ro ribonucleoprotein